MSAAELSPDPKAPAPVQVLTKKGVAVSQLESAILFWFHYGDPISILTLANAANNCYTALGGHAGKPSYFGQWLRTQSQTFQDRTRYVQNWVKHGRMDMKKKPRYAPIIAEALIVDSIECHQNLFGKMTDLMCLFVARFAVENPNLAYGMRAPWLFDRLGAENLVDVDRPKFLHESLKGFGAI